MRKSAELVVDVCFQVKDGDVVTIITDNRRKEEADMVATVVSERGGWPIVASAWGYQLPLDRADDPRLKTFMSEFEQNPAGPEPGASCSGSQGTP